MGLFKPFAFYEQKVVVGGIDPDAQSFLTATGITDPTIESAINQLVLDLKSYGIWSKMIAIYPIVGGTADTHKFNLKNPQNTDAAYRITWAGTVTHNAYGFQGNGTTGVGYTHIQIATALSQNNVSAAMYVRTVAGGGTDYGSISGGNGMQLNTRYTDNLNYNKLMHGGAHFTQASTDGSGFWQQSRTSSSSYYVQQNTTRNTASVASSTPPSGEYIALAAIGTAETTAVGFSAKQYSFASFGSGLSTTEMDNYNTAVQSFQETLGRNIGMATDASVLLLDATNPSSYPGSGTTWTDLSGNGNNANVSLITSYWNAGGYFDFPGTDYTKIATVTHASSLNIFDGDFTILVVGTVDALASGVGDNVGPIAKINWDSNPGWGILINRLSGGSDIGRMNLRLSGNWTNFSPNPIYSSVGDWFVLQVVRSGSTVTYYDTTNTSIGSGTNSGNGNNSSNITIGRGKNDATYNYKWDGKIAGIGLYDKALSSTERQQNIDYFSNQLGF